MNKETLTQSHEISWIIKEVTHDDGDPLSPTGTVAWVSDLPEGDRIGDYVAISGIPNDEMMEEIKKPLREQAQEVIFIVANMRIADKRFFINEISRRLFERYLNTWVESTEIFGKYCVKNGSKREWHRKGLKYYFAKLEIYAFTKIFKLMFKLI